MQSVSHKISLPVKIICYGLWIGAVVFLGWLAEKNVIVSGKFQVDYDIVNGSPLVKNFASKEKDRLIGTDNTPGDKNFFQLITTTPLYFDVRLPRIFRRATVRVRYQNPDLQPVIQLGVKQANNAWYFQDIVATHPKLRTLPDYWMKLRDGSLVLWQKNVEYLKEKQSQEKAFNQEKANLEKREKQELQKLESETPAQDQGQAYQERKRAVEDSYGAQLRALAAEHTVVPDGFPLKYPSISTFLASPPDPEKVIEYNYDLSSRYLLPEYQKSTKSIEFNKSIRGKHELWTYIGSDEMLNFTFTTRDINRHAGPDAFRAIVMSEGGKALHEFTLPDDGTEAATGGVTVERMLSVNLFVPPGIYRIKLDIPDDLFVTKIVTTQHLVMFKENIYLTDNEEYREVLGQKALTPTVLYTTSATIRARTSHETSLQTLSVGRQSLSLDTVHNLYEVKTRDGVSALSSPKNDVYIEGDGFFAFAKEQIFDQDYAQIADLDEVDSVDDYEYIFAQYPEASSDGEDLIAEGTVEAPQLFIQRNGDYMANFMFNLPGLPEAGRTIKIKSVSIIFEKDPLTISRLISKFREIIR